MGLEEMMEDAGFKTEVNVDEGFKKYKGTYLCTLTVLRPETDEANDNAFYYQVEFDITHVLEGMPKRESQYSDISKRVYVDWASNDPKALKALKKLRDDIFTATRIDMPKKQVEFEAKFAELIGKSFFLNTWGWKREGKKEAQMYKVLTKEDAEKKAATATTEEIPF